MARMSIRWWPTSLTYNSRTRLGHYVVSIRWCHMPHYMSEYGFIARDISWPLNPILGVFDWPPKSYELIWFFFSAIQKVVFLRLSILLLNTWKPTFVKLGWDSTQYVPKKYRNSLQTNRYFLKLVRWSFKWCNKRGISWKKLFINVSCFRN